MTIQHKYKTFDLTMYAYKCRLISGNLELTEHVDAKWMKKSELKSLDWAEADKDLVIKLCI